MRMVSLNRARLNFMAANKMFVLKLKFSVRGHHGYILYILRIILRYIRIYIGLKDIFSTLLHLLMCPWRMIKGSHWTAHASWMRILLIFWRWRIYLWPPKTMATRAFLANGRNRELCAIFADVSHIVCAVGVVVCWRRSSTCTCASCVSFNIFWWSLLCFLA